MTVIKEENGRVTMSMEDYELARLRLFTNSAGERYRESGSDSLLRMAEETLEALRDVREKASPQPENQAHLQHPASRTGRASGGCTG